MARASQGTLVAAGTPASDPSSKKEGVGEKDAKAASATTDKPNDIKRTENDTASNLSNQTSALNAAEKLNSKSPQGATSRKTAAFHKLEEGDTWELIAKQYGISLDNLRKTNNVNSTARSLPPVGSPVLMTPEGGSSVFVQATESDKPACGIWNPCGKLNQTVVSPFLLPVWTCDPLESCTCAICAPSFVSMTCGCTTFI